MADNNEKSAAQVLAETARTSATAVKAAGLAASGNLAGAAIELLKDERIRKGIISVILCISLLTTAVSMCIGSAISGVVEHLAATWSENWEENKEEAAVNSGGNILYYYTIGAVTSIGKTMVETLEDLFVSDHTVDGADATNSSLGGQKVKQSDYQTYIASVKDQEFLSGEHGALAKNLGMIKSRVAQRGKQIAETVNSYERSSIGYALAEILAQAYSNPILFAGVDLENCSITVDTSAFQLTDLQALKILAAYSVQHDCDLNDIDMYDLMDYCGWYDLRKSKLDTNTDQTLLSDSIYAWDGKTVLGMEIGGIQERTEIKEYELPAPSVPRWQGTMGPQWYYEEIAQIRSHNEILTKAADGEEIPVTGNTGEILWKFQDDDDELDLSSFTRLSSVKTIGLVDKIFTNGEARMKVYRTDYHGADEAIREGLQEAIEVTSESVQRFLSQLFGGKDSILSDQWNSAYKAATTTTAQGNTVDRDDVGNHSVTITKGRTGTTKGPSVEEGKTVTYYYYAQSRSGIKSAKVAATADGAAVTLAGLKGDTEYTIYEETVTTTSQQAPTESTRPGSSGGHRNPATTPPHVTTIDKSHTTEVTTTTTEVFDTFVSLPNRNELQSYQIQFDVNIVYSPASIDDLALDIMGLWPGSLVDTEEYNGLEYASGEPGNVLLKKQWQDIYTDPNGSEHILTFERQFAYQYETYINLIEAVGELLNLDTTGISSKDISKGGDIVAVANAEYEYYHANNLQGGARYWDMAHEATGAWVDPTAGWCVTFVYACAWQCGYIGEGLTFGPSWYFGVANAWHFIAQDGKAEQHREESYRPVPGDLIFFHNATELSHIGIVEYVDDEDKCHIIHGNTNPGSIVNKTTYTSYKVGTNCGDADIYGYLHPDYPNTNDSDPAYLTITGIARPTIQSRYVTSDILISGLGRFRESQLQTVVDKLASDYPALYREDLQTALDQKDMELFRTTWNSICSSGQSESFRKAQLNISQKEFVDPIAAKVKSSTGFDWNRTGTRTDILKAIVTTSDQTDALVDILCTLASRMDNKTKDDDLLDFLTTEDLLINLLTDRKSALWPTDPDSLQFDWINSISSTLRKVASTSTSTGSLNSEFYIDIPNKDPNYKGHAVTGLTDAQIHNIKNTIYGEATSLSLDAHIAVAQTIRDNIDRSSGLNYDNFIKQCGYYGGMYERSDEKICTDLVEQAFDYVFNKGGSAVQHPIWVFYAHSPSDGLYDDSDFQQYFTATLVFVVQCGNTRFFSWEYR